MLSIVELDPAPLADLRYLNAARRGGTEVHHLTVQRAFVRGLPDGLDAIVATSDLHLQRAGGQPARRPW